MTQQSAITGEELADKISLAAASVSDGEHSLEYLLLPEERTYLSRAMRYLKEAGFRTSVFDNELLVRW